MSRVAITTGDTNGGKRRAATQYGRRVEESYAASEFMVRQGVWAIAFTFRYDMLPDSTFLQAANGDELYMRVPAGARVLEAKFKVTEAFLGGTSLAAGLAIEDGTEGGLDLDGLITDLNAPLASLGAGAYVDGDGALVGASPGLAVDGIPAITATGTFTAGEATLYIEYEVPDDRIQLMNG